MLNCMGKLLVERKRNFSRRYTQINADGFKYKEQLVFGF